jgi:membrane-bound lytic murein transglycosylase D
MAITAYNHGLAGVRRAMHAHGDTELVAILRNYDGRAFGFASRNFYVAFLAAMEIDQNPEKFFPGVVPDKPVDYSLFRLPDYMPTTAVANALGISERELARHNPAVQATVWQGSKYLPRDLEIRVPATALSASLSELISSVSPSDRHGKQLPDLYHTIARGDTLSALAAEYGTSVSTLVALNNLGSSHRIRAGQKLRLPAAGPAPAIVAAEVPVESPPVAEPAVEPELPADVLASAPALDDIADEGLVAESALMEDPASPGEEPAQSLLLSDPSDYSVDKQTTIEVQPLETLGHYADWLGIKTQRLRDINGLAFRTPVEVGKRIKLDLSKVDAETFENVRTTWHRQQQDAFFRSHRISGVTEHVVGRGESVWILSLRQYEVPVWLFRQYNPELDLHSVRPGTKIRFPVLVEGDGT